MATSESLLLIVLLFLLPSSSLQRMRHPRTKESPHGKENEKAGEEDVHFWEIRKIRAISYYLCRCHELHAFYPGFIFSIEAILLKARRTAIWQLLSALLHDTARQAERPIGLAAIVGNLDAVRDHSIGLVLVVLYLGSGFAAREGVVEIRDIDNSCGGVRVAPKERRLLIQTLGHERRDGWDGGHSRQACGHGGFVRVQDLAAVGEVAGSVGGVVVDDHHVDRAVEEGPYRVALEADTDAAVDEL